MRRPHCYSHSWVAAMIVAALGLLAVPVGAAETDDDTDTAVAQAHESAGEEAHGQVVEHGAEHAEHGEEHGEHAEHAKNGLALFLGGTVETVEDETFFTIGGEYERHLADRWGVQLVVEHVNDFDAWVVIAPVGFRLVDKLWFVTGPGLETESRRNEEHDGGHDVVEHSAEIHGEEEGGPFFLWRFGLGYSFHLGHSFGVMPSVNFDVVREHGEWAEAWVLGVSLTYHF
jgi:hypothetical protein